MQQGGYPAALPDSTTLVSRLVVRQGGTTEDAQMQPLPDAKSLVSADPPFPFSAALSGDGHYVFVVPDGFLTPGTDYSLRLSGTYGAGGLRVGPLTIGATDAGSFGDTIRFRTAPGGGSLPYSARGGANVRPRGVRASKLTLQRPAESEDGSATALLKLARGVRYPAGAHAVHILLTDASSGDVVSITYRKNTSLTKDRRGNVASVKLVIPAGTSMPSSVRAYVIGDVYPLLMRDV